MAIEVSQYFLFFFAFVLVTACILTVLLKNDLSLFTLGLVGLSITLFSLNICSILGFCPNDVELVKYDKNQSKCYPGARQSKVSQHPCFLHG